MINLRRKHFVAIHYADGSDDDEDVRVRWCPNCEKYGQFKKLGPMIVEYGKDPPPDHDLFLSCYFCYGVFPKYTTKVEQTLEGFAEPLESPYESGFETEGLKKRYTKEGKKALEKRRAERNRAHHHDKEIDDAIRRFGEENVHILYDSQEEGDTR